MDKEYERLEKFRQREDLDKLSIDAKCLLMYGITEQEYNKKVGEIANAFVEGWLYCSLSNKIFDTQKEALSYIEKHWQQIEESAESWWSGTLDCLLDSKGGKEKYLTGLAYMFSKEENPDGF